MKLARSAWAFIIKHVYRLPGLPCPLGGALSSDRKLCVPAVVELPNPTIRSRMLVTEIQRDDGQLARLTVLRVKLI
jgi:hypothetical protein